MRNQLVNNWVIQVDSDSASCSIRFESTKSTFKSNQIGGGQSTFFKKERDVFKPFQMSDMTKELVIIDMSDENQHNRYEKIDGVN